MEQRSYESRLENGAWVTGQSGGRIDMDKPGEVFELGPDDEAVILLTTGRHPIKDILEERERQDEKWGPVPRLGHTSGKWLKILMEEIGEYCEAELEGIGYYAEEKELIQAAAVLVAWLEHRASIRAMQEGTQ